MSIKAKVFVRRSAITKERVASAAIVGLNPMKFAEFCDYLAQDSTVGAADVAAVMTHVEKKLPMLLSMGMKVEISPGGMMVRPTVRGSLTQTQLKARLEAKKEAGDKTVDVSRSLQAADLATSDLVVGVDIDFGKKFRTAFRHEASFQRVNADDEASAAKE